VIVAIVLSLIPGCSGKGDSNPTIPGSDTVIQQDEARSVGSAGNRWMWGLWDVTILADRSTVEVAPVRIAAMHLNVVRLIEVTPCHDCLRIGNITPVAPNTIEVDVTLIHPFPGLDKYTGFDVRGVFISEGNFTFPSSGRMIALGDDVPTVLNADGYTSLFNPTEFPPTAPPALGYIAGKYATGGDLTSTLNPFLAYRRDAPRRIFEAGGSETRTFRLYAPPGPIHFGYAVDASWQLVQGEITDPLTDFPPDANCLEAYKISVDIPYDVNSSWMSQNPINVEVFDHQGIATISTVTIEAPDLFSGEASLSLSTQTGEESWLFSGFIVNELEPMHRSYPLLVKVLDTDSDQNLGQINAWDVSSARVKEGWARTWGGEKWENSTAVTVDSSGNVYVGGHYQDDVDFDPGAGFDIHTSNGNYDCFLSKFDANGLFQWARVWGGMDSDSVSSVECDSSGDIYLAGNFRCQPDFDPGPGEDIHASQGASDIFLMKFDSSGNFQWAKTWGGNSDDVGCSAAVDSLDFIYVCGSFRNTVDFDPGPGIDSHTAHGIMQATDVFLTKFDPNGNYQGVRTWGGNDGDCSSDLAIDSSDTVYLTGYFSRTVDFDPGSGVANHTSNGWEDIFLCSFYSDGAFNWARTWGGRLSDRSQDVDSDGAGNLYVTGNFEGLVDLDPGDGEDWHGEFAYCYNFLSKFDSAGAFQWARSWGYWEYTALCMNLSVNLDGDLFLAGAFDETIDFNPGAGVDNHTSNGGSDLYLTRIDPNGTYVWTHTWGGSSREDAYGLTLDSIGYIYISGHYWSNDMDFDPGIGVDIHTPYSNSDIFVCKLLPDVSF